MLKENVGSKLPVYPMPVIIVGANVEDKANFLTVVWFSMANFKPPTIAVVLNKGHYTNGGILQNKTFSINVPSTKLLEATDYCSVVSGFDQDKSKIFDVFYGELKSAPMITECPLSAECRVVQTIEFATHEVFFGEIIKTYAEHDILTNGRPDVAKADPILYSMYDNNYWTLGENVGRAMHIGKRFKPSD
ncbi:MAG: flavin reductase family protein [candidate division WOR-3 bacterium]|jgi:flavin reductase (DIM6/NTAB) family NADH-FMN oxidoreductase RutF